MYQLNVMPSNRKCIKTYVTDEEYQRIADSARQSGLSMSMFLRRVCTGLVIESKVDATAVRELIRINADMGRLGGLLKMWLANDMPHSADVRRLLNDLLASKDSLTEKIHRI